MSLLISSKSFFFLIYSGKPFLILGAAVVNDLSPVTKSAFGLNGMVLVLQSTAHITPQVISRTSFSIDEIT